MFVLATVGARWQIASGSNQQSVVVHQLSLRTDVAKSNNLPANSYQTQQTTKMTNQQKMKQITNQQNKMKIHLACQPST
jgi:hypothetical protein